MDKGHAGMERQALGCRPTEIKVGVQVGIQLGAHDFIRRILIRMVRMPACRKPEIPFVVEGNLPSYGSDAGTLEQIKRHGVAQPLRFAESVKPYPDTLINTAVKAVEKRAITITESILRMP